MSCSTAVWRFISPIILCNTSCIINRWLFMVSTFAMKVFFSYDCWISIILLFFINLCLSISLHFLLSSLLSIPLFNILFQHLFLLEFSIQMDGNRTLKSCPKNKIQFTAEKIIHYRNSSGFVRLNRGYGILRISLVGWTSTIGYDVAGFLGGDRKSGLTVVRLTRLAHRLLDSFLPIFAKWFPITKSIGSLLSCK